MAELTVLQELQALRFVQPGPDAAGEEIAAWYERKADVLDRIADTSGAFEAARARIQAMSARDRAASFRLGVAA